MIEREGAIRIYSEILANTLGAKMAKGRLIRISTDGYYEVLLEASGRNFTALLPVASTIVMAAEPEQDIPTLEVER
jgi:hypothetical protein